jgi:type I restriction enzyme S subunit
MSDNWPKVCLCDLAHITSGKRPTVISTKASSDFNVPVIGGGGPCGFTKRPLFNEPVLITGRVGTLGKLYAPKEACWPSDNTLVIIPNNQKTFHSFLKYSLSYQISETIGMNRGAANPLITQRDLGRIKVYMPPFDLQKAIAHILGTLDDKIELNRRMNETLEQMARAIFKSWFVDFEPVRAKMSGRWKKGQSLPGLPAHLWDLFPDRLIPSELGEIPQGWKLGKFGDCCIVKGGFAYKSKDFVKKGYPLVRIKNITTARTIDLSDAACIPERIVNQTENFKLFDGDLVIAMTGANIGKFGLVVNPDQIPFSLINQRVAKVIPKDVTSPKPWFPFLAMIESNIFGQIINLGGGSAQPNISSGQIEDCTFLIPDNKIISALNKAVDPLMQRWILNIKQCRTLAKSKDVLLPKIISGKIDLNKIKDIYGGIYARSQ